MSLNRGEQDLFDYIQGHPEEKRHWQEKVQRIAAGAADHHAAAGEIDVELGRYYRERATVVPAFREAKAREAGNRISLRSLAEYLVRIWGPPRPKRPAGTGSLPYA